MKKNVEFHLVCLALHMWALKIFTLSESWVKIKGKRFLAEQLSADLGVSLNLCLHHKNAEYIIRKSVYSQSQWGPYFCGHGEGLGNSCAPTRGHNYHNWELTALGLCFLPVGSAWYSLPKFVFFELSLSGVAKLQGLTFSFFGCVNIVD